MKNSHHLHIGFKKLPSPDSGETRVLFEIEGDGNEPGILARFSAAIFALRWNIVRGSIQTDGNGNWKDVFQLSSLGLESGQGEAFSNNSISQLAGIVTAVLDNHEAPAAILEKYQPGILDAMPLEKELFEKQMPFLEILFENDNKRDSSMLFIEMEDRPGLLYNISSVLMEEGFDIREAKIETNPANGRVEDTFWLWSADERDHQPLDENRVNSIKDRIINGYQTLR